MTAASFWRLKQRLEQRPASAAIKVETDEAIFRLPWDHPNQDVGAALWAAALRRADLTLAAALGS